MDAHATFEADSEALELVQPGDGAYGFPALLVSSERAAAVRRSECRIDLEFTSTAKDETADRRGSEGRTTQTFGSVCRARPPSQVVLRSFRPAEPGERHGQVYNAGFTWACRKPFEASRLVRKAMREAGSRRLEKAAMEEANSAAASDGGSRRRV